MSLLPRTWGPQTQQGAAQYYARLMAIGQALFVKIPNCTLNGHSLEHGCGLNLLDPGADMMMTGIRSLDGLSLGSPGYNDLSLPVGELYRLLAHLA